MSVTCCHVHVRPPEDVVIDAMQCTEDEMEPSGHVADLKAPAGDLW
ncbi:hypothetical protein AF72_12865 [Xylella taiwanensis]|uniref:Uncharacterized protein n=1 Tax=Xylella taiwanensis TaxID=1444770 RepID=Z9JFA6_9GAMM|nr:hypothetical protein AF72_12865 [Xylella taiwanensis]